MEYPSEHYKLIEELKTRNFIKSTSVARVMKEVDRADYVNMLPYTDWFHLPPFSNLNFKAPRQSDTQPTSQPLTWTPFA